MSDRDEPWDPADGPPPTPAERDDARALAAALDNPGAVRRGVDTDLDALLDAAHRVTATAHPDDARSRAVAAAAVEHAVTHASPRWLRARWRWLALVAAAVVGLGGLQLAVFHASPDDTPPAITRAAGNVFDAPLARDPGSAPIGRIADARTRAYRDVILRGHGGRRWP